jgi:hypothetical protein
MRILAITALSAIKGGYTYRYPENVSELISNTVHDSITYTSSAIMFESVLGVGYKNLTPELVFQSVPFVIIKNLVEYFFFTPQHSCND